MFRVATATSCSASAWISYVSQWQCIAQRRH
nr:MAG TPA: hypothetical protein [Caudoviricetes sp.]